MRARWIVIGAVVTAAVAGGALAVADQAGLVRDEVRIVPVDRVQIVGGDGRELSVGYLAGTTAGCGEPTGVDVREEAERVVLTARVTYRVEGESRGCLLEGRRDVVTVTLAEPLGDRRLVDAHDERREILVIR